MSPRYVPPSPKGPKPPAYLERYLKTFDKVGPPYRLSWRDEYAFLWRQWQRRRVAERNAHEAWFDKPPSVPPARIARPEPDSHEEVPEPEPREVAPVETPPAPAKRKSRFQTLEL